MLSSRSLWLLISLDSEVGSFLASETIMLFQICLAHRHQHAWLNSSKKQTSKSPLTFLNPMHMLSISRMPQVSARVTSCLRRYQNYFANVYGPLAYQPG